MPLSLRKTISNIPGSAGRFVGGIAETITHPVATAKGLGKVGLGGIQSLIPGEQGNEEAFRQTYQFFKNRYGSTQKLSRTIEEDPVGFIADLSTFFTVAGGAIRGVGAVSKVSKVSQAGQALQKVGAATEPLGIGTRLGAKAVRQPLKAGISLGRESLGVSTGVGGDVIREAFRAGKRLSPEFRDALRGKTTQENILSAAREGLDSIKESRSEAYLGRLNQLKKSKTTIDISPIGKTVDIQLGKFGVRRKLGGVLDFSRSTISDTSEQARVSSMVDVVKTWGAQKGDRTIIGLDLLKRRLDDFYSPSRQARAITAALSGKVKEIIHKNFPEYTTMTKEYAQASELIQDIEKSLGVGGRADVAVGKLARVLKQDNDFKKRLVQVLDEATGKDITAQIAGTSLSPGVPSGLVGRNIFAGILGIGWIANPNIWFGLAGTSPRIVGEFLRAAGIASEKTEQVIARLEKIGVFSVGKRQVAFQAGRQTTQSGEEIPVQSLYDILYGPETPENLEETEPQRRGVQ